MEDPAADVGDRLLLTPLLTLLDEESPLLVVDASPVEDVAVDVGDMLVLLLSSSSSSSSPPPLSAVLDGVPSLLEVDDTGEFPVLLGLVMGGSPVLETLPLGVGVGGTGVLLVEPILPLLAGVVAGRLLCPLPLVVAGPGPGVGGMIGPRIMM